MISDGKVLQKNKGDILIRPEDASDYYVFLVSGSARGYIIDEEGKEFTFRFAYKSGDLLTDGSISSSDYSFYWESLEKSEFLYLPNKYSVAFLSPVTDNSTNSSSVIFM